MRRTGWLFAAGLLLLLGCKDHPDVPKDAGGQVSGEWTGADTGSFRAPAVAEWCDSAQAFTIMAIRGDTGLALAIHSRTRPEPGRYEVREPPPQGRPILKPVAGAALRWLGKTRVVGYQADRGMVQLSRIGTVAAGRFDVRLRGVGNDSGEVRLTGTFDKVPVAPRSVPCVAGVDSTHGTDILP